MLYVSQAVEGDGDGFFNIGYDTLRIDLNGFKIYFLTGPNFKLIYREIISFKGHKFVDHGILYLWFSIKTAREKMPLSI